MITVETYNSVSEAASAMGQGSQFFGGGTLMMRSINYGEHRFSKIVRTNDPVLRSVENAGDRIVIGASVTMSDVMASREISFLAPVARSVGGPAVRNMATVGGNLFARHPYGDFTTALLALEGMVKIAGGQEQPLEEFLSGREQFSGIVQSVSILRPSGSDFKFKKVSRIKPKGVSVLSIAAWVPQAGGRVQNARIAFGAMGSTPLRAKAAEQAVNNNSLDSASVDAAVKAVASDFSPPDDALASGWYRSQIAPVHLRRLLLNEEQR